MQERVHTCTLVANICLAQSTLLSFRLAIKEKFFHRVRDPPNWVAVGLLKPGKTCLSAAEPALS